MNLSIYSEIKQKLINLDFKIIYSNHSNTEIDFAKDGVRIRYNIERNIITLHKDMISKRPFYGLISLQYAPDDWNEIINVFEFFKNK